MFVTALGPVTESQRLCWLATDGGIFGGDARLKLDGFLARVVAAQFGQHDLVTAGSLPTQDI